MAYLEKVIDRGNVIEVQKYINGRYGIREKERKQQHRELHQKNS